MGFIAASDGVARAKACGALVAVTEALPTRVSVSVSVSMTVTVSPEVANESVGVLEGGRLLEVTVVVDVAVPMLGGGGLELGVAGGTIGNVVFRAGHPEDLVSRRTGQ